MNVRPSGVFVFCAVAVWATIGCGASAPLVDAGASGTGGADSAAPVDAVDAGTDAATVAINQFGQSYIATLCARVYDCCPANLRAAVAPYGTDVASCRDNFALAAGQLSASISEEAAMGRVTYDGLLVAQCLHNFTTQSCDQIRAVYDYTNSDPICKEAILGKVDLGGTCVANEGCRGGWCDAASGFKCAALKPNGGSCDDDNQCQSAACDGANTGTCIDSPDGLCTPHF
ncbi:MAG TPA: hypothetical protein VH374_10730 [Polyangia bacterium]|jgi:hypothetical protein|nr:hypothetical protein [Polyangia bacterium]